MPQEVSYILFITLHHCLASNFLKVAAATLIYIFLHFLTFIFPAIEFVHKEKQQLE